jgi:hypothetical protein
MPPRATLSTFLAGGAAGTTADLSVVPQLKASQEFKMINCPRRIAFFMFPPFRFAISLSLQINIDGHDLAIPAHVKRHHSNTKFRVPKSL